MASIFEAGQKAPTIHTLKEQLRTDPSNVEIRAKLGELQYRPPATPVTDRSRAQVPIRVAELTIEVRNPCNYRCHYCVAAGQNNEPVKHFDLAAINKSLGLIKAELIVFSLDCGGGEPTVHPQFPELIQLLSSYGPVSFPTNNSQKPERWLPREFAKRLTIRSAIHPEAEEKFDLYIANARYLTEAGCNFCALYIAHPERISKIASYQQRFASESIPFVPVAFLGEHNGKQYPNSYTTEERELIGLNQESRYWYHKLEPHATRIRNFRGIPCIAGYRNMFIGRDGSVRRCLYDKRKLDAPLEKPEPCAVKNCGCGLMLDKLNSTEGALFYNNWGPAAGYKPIDLSALFELVSPEGINEDLFREGVAVYDELMRAYAKDEIPES